MRKAFLVILLITLGGKGVLAQGKLMIFPKSIEFADSFHRLSNLYFVNNGDSSVTIKDISYNSDAYFVRFDKFWYYPITLQPGDSLLMDCILQSYYLISPSDTVDTMTVYSDNNAALAKIKIKIDYYDDFTNGAIDGRITDGSNPVAGAAVQFYSRNLIVQSTVTDNNGYYYAVLKPGEYKISAEKDSFYVTFFGQKPSPYNARRVNLKSDSTINANIILDRMGNSGISVSGQVYDSPTDNLLRRGMVVIRTGTHTPSKLSTNSDVNDSQSDVYTAIIQNNGTYKINNITKPGYYYIQALSDYYVPSYYNTASKPVSFWQNADSLLIGSPPQGVNIFMSRDSTFGNGQVSGKILINNSSDTTNSGTIILVQSLNSDSSIIGYAFTDSAGNFTVYNLPYGTFKLRAQKIGYSDIYSEIINIDSLNPSVAGIAMNFNIAGIKDEPTIPSDFQLYQNYPNPFNPSTIISYYLPYGTKALLRVVNLLGQEVAVLNNGYTTAGNHKVTFNGSKLASGIYFVNLITGGKSFSRKIILLK